MKPLGTVVLFNGVFVGPWYLELCPKKSSWDCYLMLVGDLYYLNKLIGNTACRGSRNQIGLGLIRGESRFNLEAKLGSKILP